MIKNTNQNSKKTIELVPNILMFGLYTVSTRNKVIPVAKKKKRFNKKFLKIPTGAIFGNIITNKGKIAPTKDISNPITEIYVNIIISP
jgi:hypothetical protein